MRADPSSSNDSSPGEPGPLPPPPGREHDPRAAYYLDAFRRLHGRQRLANLGVALWALGWASIAIFFTVFAESASPLGFLGLSFLFLGILVGAIFQYLNYRCPCCRKAQGRVPKPRFCFNCGIRFRE